MSELKMNARQEKMFNTLVENGKKQVLTFKKDRELLAKMIKEAFKKLEKIKGGFKAYCDELGISKAQAYRYLNSKIGENGEFIIDNGNKSKEDKKESEEALINEDGSVNDKHPESKVQIAKKFFETFTKVDTSKLDEEALLKLANSVGQVIKKK